MDKVINLIKNTIEEIDKNLRANLDGSVRVRLNPSLEKLLLVLDSPEIRYSLEKYEDLSKKFEMINKEPLNCSQIENGMSLCIIQKSRIKELEAKLAEHNEYFRSFSCENFNEFQDFISTFMLTPHEEQTLIKELKQQLAEKDKRIHEVENTFNVSAIALAEKFKKIKELKQQLAEKEKEIEYLTKQAKRFNNEAQKYFEDAYCNDAIYQDKISFATQNLENLRNEITANSHYFKVDTEFYKYIYETIGEKIKRLKGGV